MEKDIKVSIIVPVYNSEKYIGKSIESLIKQTLTDIEIILINDGSKDNSGMICDKYATIDKRIVVIHKENAGQAKARNVGIDIAKGKYIMFLDADDMYEPDTCEKMYKIAEENEVDYASANYIMIDENDVKRPKPAFDTEKYGEFELKLSDYTKSFFVMNSTPWNKIYKLKFLNKNKIRFDVNPPSEDDYFTTLCYMKAQKGYYTNKVIYDYRYNPDSTSNKCDKIYFEKQNLVYKEIYKNFMKNKKIGFYRYYYAKKNAYLLCKIIDSELVTDIEKIEILKELHWYFDLAKEIKVYIANESLKPIFIDIRTKNYEQAIKKMNEVKEIRKTYSVFEKSRMSFPSSENYAEMSKYDDEFKM